MSLELRVGRFNVPPSAYTFSSQIYDLVERKIERRVKSNLFDTTVFLATQDTPLSSLLPSQHIVIK